MENKLHNKWPSNGPLTLLACILTLLGGCFSADAIALPPMNMPYGVTPIAHEVYHLHMAIFYICCVIGAAVFATIIYSLIKHRKSKGAVAAQFHEHMGVEILWAVIPFIILVIMAIPATKVLFDIHDTSKPDLNIKVTGYQWRWGYDYLDQNIHFMSNLSTPMAQRQNHAKKDLHYLQEVDHQIVVPIKEKIRFLITANDVIHSWWVPAFGIKQDAIPGYINETWAYINKTGYYRGQCGELCGAFHGFMPIVVHAVTQKQFAQWVAQKQHKHFEEVSATTIAPQHLTHEKLMIAGKKLYDTVCAVCHGVNGKSISEASFPSMAGSKVATGSLDQHISIVLNGVKGTAMAPFASQYNDEEIASIVTYERTAFGNDAINTKNKLPTTVQPADVAKLRQHQA